MGTYGFLMTHPEPSVELDILKVESEVRRWLSSYSKIERYGGRAGKVVRFNEKKYLEDLGSGKNEVVELYSARKYDKGECSEILNCEFSVVASKENGVLFSVDSQRVSLTALIDSFFDLPVVSDAPDYAYAYEDSHAFGLGYARGIYMPDENHPLMWSRRSEAGAWIRLQWAGRTDLFIRDVYPVNFFSDRKISALPSEKRLALESALKRFGVCDTRGKFTVWALDDHELEAARAELKAVELLASYCP